MYQPTFYELLQQIQERLFKLEEENKELKKQIQEIKPIVIENINYKIQEINVEELKGTLNIGWTGEADAKEVSKMVGEISNNSQEESGS